MGKAYSNQQREEAMKLAREIGTAAAGQRLGISVDTIYTWQSKARKRAAAPPSPMGEGELAAEVASLRKKLREQEEEIEILQDALGFFAKRRKK